MGCNFRILMPTVPHVASLIEVAAKDFQLDKPDSPLSVFKKLINELLPTEALDKVPGGLRAALERLARNVLTRSKKDRT